MAGAYKSVDKIMSVEEIDTITLVLTEQEAEALAQLCYRTGGAPDTRRADIDHINAALKTVGFYGSDGAATGTIRF